MMSRMLFDNENTFGDANEFGQHKGARNLGSDTKLIQDRHIDDMHR